MQLAVFTAWNVARLTNYCQKLPHLAKELERFAALKPKPVRRQSREEMIAAMRAITARTVH